MIQDNQYTKGVIEKAEAEENGWLITIESGGSTFLTNRTMSN